MNLYLKNEQNLLRISIFSTILLAGIGIIFGLLASSSTIIFDSIYAMIDAVMTTLALIVARLITSSTSKDFIHNKLEKHFTMGFWHLEPIVLGVNGILLIGAATYAFINAIDSFLLGGREILFGYAIVITLISIVVELSLGIFIKKANNEIKSEFLNLDSISWLISASMSLGYLIAFSFGYIAKDTSLQWITPYIDPLVLIIVCIFIIPMPFKTVKQALADILLVTPSELKSHVDTVAENIVKKYGFESFRAYVARVGRGRQIELYFIVPKSWPPKKLEEWDLLRDEIEKELGKEDPDLWLTIVFTTDFEWAE
ncbi:cation diffusion facilitator family transporter [Aliarcobacter butzleri]|uniref:Cation transporter n=1 Tax=Aliarcobacter butzleri TaxID=28197 RepID=A0AAW7Q9M0_9BACT|nr:cation transporter [Aliarcobacter butzleri]MCP3648543.1 cation transporter [Arcobacter sp. DNRA7]MCR1814716.1 cation transporter [Aliarcobacter butzleri]MDN5106166.1 cation transporter [Aliarcobacter butzleri]MDN5122608.1 cation transporter [Aliarcobacter butzleri]